MKGHIQMATVPGLRVTWMSEGDTWVPVRVALTSTLTSGCSMASRPQPFLSRFSGRSQRWDTPAPSRNACRGPKVKGHRV